MPLSESKKKSNERWNKNKSKQITIRLMNEEYELFERYCKKHNISKSGLIRSRIEDVIKK